jgi:hypothetical protein
MRVWGVRHGTAWGLVLQHCGTSLYCSWGYTARLGGPPREALYTVALRGVR